MKTKEAMETLVRAEIAAGKFGEINMSTFGHYSDELLYGGGPWR